ncbi:MAG: single-stranded DNA-binding protein [Mogibacterium sp.]|nr:single-stranded DNA-binding protein [Mogibacterium sp.]
MNSVILIGRLARDPELSYTPNNQTPVTRFTLAVDRPTQAGQERQADFIRITVFGRQAETVAQYQKKGSQVAVSGRIQTGSYKNREGVTVYTTDIIASRVEFLGSAGGNAGNGGNGGSAFGGSFGGSDNFGGQSDSMTRNQSSFEEQPYPDSFQEINEDMPF